MKVKSSLLIAFTLGAMLSCNPQAPSAKTSYNIELQGNVTEFTVNGTPCIFVSDGNAGGLSCRW